MQKTILLIMIFIVATIIYSQNPCPGVTTVTYSGKTYNTVQIGSQCWLKENLDIGTMIQVSQEQTNNGIIEKYCYYDSTINCDRYGGLYQWAEAVQYKNGATNSTSTSPALIGNVQGICPSGWHIPSYGEFLTLQTTVDTNGNELKTINQGAGSGVGTNTSGFSALLAGGRHNYFYFYQLGLNTNFWNSTAYDTINSYYIRLYYNNSNIYLNSTNKEFGFSVRCLKD